MNQPPVKPPQTWQEFFQPLVATVKAASEARVRAAQIEADAMIKRAEIEARAEPLRLLCAVLYMVGFLAVILIFCL